MKADYVNNKTPSRYSWFLKLSGVLALLLAFFFLRYYFAPYEVQTGQSYSRTWFSKTEWQVMSVLSLLLIIPSIFWSRIVIRVSVDSLNNSLSLDMIERFSWKIRTRTLLLSHVQIQTERLNTNTRWYQPSRDETLILYLSHPDVGTITISGMDFGNIGEIVQAFEDLKQDAARSLRISRRRRRGRGLTSRSVSR
jgi:succinate dehydrogenase hydrophobic anchor subunit